MGLFSRNDNPSTSRFTMQQLLANSNRTRTGPPIERKSLSELEGQAIWANGRVVQATGDLDKIEREAAEVIGAVETETRETIERLEKNLASVRSEYKDKIEKAAAELTAAEGERVEAQHALIHRQIRDGAFEGVRDFNALVRAKLEKPAKEGVEGA